MFMTISVAAIVAILFLVLCALVCAVIVIRRMKGYKSDFLAEQKERDNLADKLSAEVREHQQTKAELKRSVAALEEAREDVTSLKGTINSNDKEINRLRGLLQKAEAKAATAIETATARDQAAQTAEANEQAMTACRDEAVKQATAAETALFAARHGEDPETDTFYAAKYPPVFDILPGANVAPESDSGAAEAPAEAVPQTEAEKAKPRKRSRESEAEKETGTPLI